MINGFNPLPKIPFTRSQNVALIVQTTNVTPVVEQAALTYYCGVSFAVKQGSTTIPHQGSYAFGSVALNTSKTVTFTVANQGTMALALTGTPAVQVNGSSFSVTKQPNTPVFPGESAVFDLTFTPTAIGSQTATVTIANRTATTNPYTITVTGTGQAQASNSFLLWTK